VVCVRVTRTPASARLHAEEKRARGVFDEGGRTLSRTDVEYFCEVSGPPKSAGVDEGREARRGRLTRDLGFGMQ